MTQPTWWNLNVVLAEIISQNLRDMARNGNTVPSNFTLTSWRAKLNSIATRLEAYKTYWDAGPEGGDLGLAVESAAKAAMHELADIFPYLWD